MRDYGKVHTSFWTSENARALSDDAKMLAFYLLTCPHGTIAGVFRLPDGYACEDLKWESGRVSKGFDELLCNGFATRCQATNWVWVIKHFDWNAPENPNQRKAVLKMAAQIPDTCSWRARYYADCADIFDPGQERLRNPSVTLSKPVAVAVAVTEEKIAPASAGESVGDQERKAEKRTANEIDTWLTSLGDADAIPADDPIFDYAERTSIPMDFLELSWIRFRDDMRDKHKRQKDWRAHYRNAVKGNWYKLWWFSPEGECRLTTTGEQAKRAAA